MAPAADVVNVTVVCGTGEVLSMDVTMGWTVGELKRGLETTFGVPVPVQNLSNVMHGTVWSDSLSMKECGIRRGSTINLWWPPLRVHRGRPAAATATAGVASPAAAGAAAAAADNHNMYQNNHNGNNHNNNHHHHNNNHNNNNGVGGGPVHLFVFDLDDTLTRNGVMSPATKRCLESLAVTHKMGVASFNLSAVEFLQRCGCLHLFDTIVCGFYTGASKNDHMAKVLEELSWPPLGNTHRGSVYFFDDQAVNVEDVRTAFPGTVCLHVRSLESLPLLVESLMSISRMRSSSGGGGGLSSPAAKSSSPSSTAAPLAPRSTAPSSIASSASTTPYAAGAAGAGSAGAAAVGGGGGANKASSPAKPVGFVPTKMGGSTPLVPHHPPSSTTSTTPFKTAGVPYPRLGDTTTTNTTTTSSSLTAGAHASSYHHRRLSMDSSDESLVGSRRNSSQDPTIDGVPPSFATMSLGSVWGSSLRV